MRPHCRQLLIDERADVEPGGHPVVRDGEGRRLAIRRKSVFHPGPLHRLGHLLEHGLWKGGVVELARPERLTPGEALDVAGIEERADRHPVRFDVVRVGVATELVLGHHHLRADPAHDLDQPADRLFFVSLPEGLRLTVAWQTGHSRVLVAQKDQLGHAQDLHGIAELGFANGRQPGGGLLGIEILVEDLAHLAAGGRHQRGTHALPAVAGQRSTHADRLVVGMRLDRQQAELACHHFPLRERTSWISWGTILCTSPTTPRSAILKMGASGSLLMAMMVRAPFMPTVCCMAPEIPSAM